MRTFTPLLSLILAACGPEVVASNTTLYFSAIPDDNRTQLQERYGLLAQYLSDALDVPVEYKSSADYGASVEAFKNGDVQLAWFGGVSGVQARQAVPGARAIAQGKIDPAFMSYFIAHRDSGLEPGEEFPLALADMAFTFGNRSSTSGRLMPHFYIEQKTGKSPAQFFGRPDCFSGSHDQTALQVQSGAVQAGVISYKTYDRMVSAGKLDPALCRRIWTTPRYPDYSWTAHPVLDATYGSGFVDRLQAVLVGVQDAAILRAMDRPEGMITAQNSDFDAIQQTMLSVGMLR